MPRAEGDDDDLLMGSDIDEDSEDEDLALDFDEDNEDSHIGLSDDDDDDDDDEKDASDADDVLSLVEGSDNEDLISLDGDVPDGLIEYDGSDASDGELDIVVDGEEEEWDGIGGGDSSSRKRKREETSGAKRKKLRSLPTFASYEDYAKMIEDGPEDDI